MEDEFKLAVEMVPKPLHFRSLKRLAPAPWKKYRAQLIQERGQACSYCGAVPEKSADIHGHEVWEYDEDGSKGVARLASVDLICKICHAVEHFGNSVMLVREGRIPPGYLADLEAHFCCVNGVTSGEFHQHLANAIADWERRSAMEWETDFGELSRLLP